MSQSVYCEIVECSRNMEGNCERQVIYINNDGKCLTNTTVPKLSEIKSITKESALEVPVPKQIEETIINISQWINKQLDQEHMLTPHEYECLPKMVQSLSELLLSFNSINNFC